MWHRYHNTKYKQQSRIPFIWIDRALFLDKRTWPKVRARRGLQSDSGFQATGYLLKPQHKSNAAQNTPRLLGLPAEDLSVRSIHT